MLKLTDIFHPCNVEPVLRGIQAQLDKRLMFYALLNDDEARCTIAICFEGEEEEPASPIDYLWNKSWFKKNIRDETLVWPKIHHDEYMVSAQLLRIMTTHLGCVEEMPRYDANDGQGIFYRAARYAPPVIACDKHGRTKHRLVNAVKDLSATFEA